MKTLTMKPSFQSPPGSENFKEPVLDEQGRKETVFAESKVPLCVDLDGTLVKTDTLLESILILLKRQPLSLFAMLLWMLRGKSFFKQQIADRVDLPADTLPYHTDFLTHLQKEFSRGRKLVLVTAANEKIAGAVADHLGLFALSFASDDRVNLSGNRKLALLEEQFGKKGFDYAGNASVDLPIWQGAASGIVVNASGGLTRKAKAGGNITQVFSDKKNYFGQFVRAIRMHQWAKNLLIFVPLLTAHLYTDPVSVTQSIWAFFAFSLCASSVYVLNDLLDLDADRRHARKRKRPFAAGNLPIPLGVAAIPCLLIPGFWIAYSLNPLFLATLLSYYFITFAYSFSLKRIELIDVFTLAILFTMRIFAGAAAIGVLVSQWLLAFSIFLFVSLAFAKRFSELHNLPKDKEKVGGRGYLSKDLPIIGTFGTSSGYISIVVLTLYTSSEQVEILYTFPERLWVICVLLFFWVSRVWLLAYRGELNEDPILFAVKDKASYLVGALAIITMFLAL